MSTQSHSSKSTRRYFLRGAAVATAATVAAPAVVKAQGPISMRWQSTWPSKDIFHEYANDFAKKVNDMTGGDLRIEVLPAGAVVPAFQLLDAVSKGVLDGGHGVVVYHYGKQTALALWGSGPAYGMDANMLLAWHKYGGGKELLEKLYKSIGANVVSYVYGPMPTQPLGWFKKPVTSVERLQGPALPHRRHLGRRVPGHGRRGHRAARRRNRGGDGPQGCSTRPSSTMPPRTASSASPTSPRSACCRATTRTPSSSRSCSTSGRFDALPATMRAIIANAVEAASADMSWKAIDRYSKDYIELQQKDKVRFYKTPDAILQRQLEVFDSVVGGEGEGKPAVQGDRGIAARVRPAGDAMGAGHRTCTAGWRSTTTSGRRRRARSDERMIASKAPSGMASGWCLVALNDLALSDGRE